MTGICTWGDKVKAPKQQEKLRPSLIIRAKKVWTALGDESPKNCELKDDQGIVASCFFPEEGVGGK